MPTDVFFFCCIMSVAPVVSWVTLEPTVLKDVGSNPAMCSFSSKLEYGKHCTTIILCVSKQKPMKNQQGKGRLNPTRDRKIKACTGPGEGVSSLWIRTRDHCSVLGKCR